MTAGVPLHVKLTFVCNSLSYHSVLPKYTRWAFIVNISVMLGFCNNTGVFFLNIFFSLFLYKNHRMKKRGSQFTVS